MFAPVRKTTVSTKNFVKKHRVVIAITATSTLWIALTVHNASELNEFLKEHNLLDAYYTDDADIDAMR